jgi:hypothetical protein
MKEAIKREVLDSGDFEFDKEAEQKNYWTNSSVYTILPF